MGKLTPIEFKKQRILTTDQLAEVYGTTVDNIKVNFNNHKDNFRKGKHYFYLEGEELKKFKSQVNNIYPPMINKFTSNLYLWTERGAKQNKIIDTTQLSPELQMFKSIFDTVAAQQIENKQIKQEITQTKAEVQNIRDVITLNSQAAWRRECNRILNAIGRELGDYTSPKAQTYEALKERGKCRPNVLISNLQKRARENGVCESKVKNLNILDVLENEPRLRDIYINIVKEMAIKNNVSLKGVI